MDEASKIRTFSDVPSADSWIEVSSQPSSSLSSIADEIITTGLRVQRDPELPRRTRHLRRSLPEDIRPGTQRRPTTRLTKQEVYNESESANESGNESDQVVSSSSEGIQIEADSLLAINSNIPIAAMSTHPSANSYSTDDDYADDDDDMATAIGTATTFQPQPNAFSHPPATVSLQRSRSGLQPSSRPSLHSRSHRNPFALQQHLPYHTLASSRQVDHDAALRASLSTLLSYAATTRSICKSKPPTTRAQTQPVMSSRIEPSTLGLVSEAVVLGEIVPGRSRAAVNDKARSRAATSNHRSPSQSHSKDCHISNKPRRSAYSSYSIAGLEEVSPTLLTWVMGAGMLVLVSAVSFSAGYVVGRETAHAEAASSIGSSASVVKRELVATRASGLGLRNITSIAIGAGA